MVKFFDPNREEVQSIGAQTLIDDLRNPTIPKMNLPLAMGLGILANPTGSGGLLSSTAKGVLDGISLFEQVENRNVSREAKALEIEQAEQKKQAEVKSNIQASTIRERIGQMLDEGDTAGAIAELSRLDPKAAVTAQTGLQKSADDLLASREGAMQRHNTALMSAQQREAASQRAADARIEAAKIAAKSRVTAAQLKESGGPAIKTPQANAIRKSVANLFGADTTFNALTGEFAGFNNPEVAEAAAAISERAMQIFMASGGKISDQAAVNQAANEAGFNISMESGKRQAPKSQTQDQKIDSFFQNFFGGQ